MAEATIGLKSGTTRLILVPALITLGITILRLTGELQHWSKAFFNPEAGGPWSVVGITWLAPLFGIYFALELIRGGQGPRSAWMALGFAVLGVGLVIGLGHLGSHMHVQQSFQERLVFTWIILILAALATRPGWPALFKTMLAYGLGARIPVAVVMFLAFRGNWGTHYDALPSDMPAGWGFWPKFLWLGLIPQLTFWVSFTIVTGMLLGGSAAVIVRYARRANGNQLGSNA